MPTLAAGSWDFQEEFLIWQDRCESDFADYQNYVKEEEISYDMAVEAFIHPDLPKDDPLYQDWYAWACGFVDRIFGIQRGGGVHICVFSPFYNRTHHFLECTTGCNERKKLTPHTLENGKCICGYEAMDNAQLTTLWLDGMRLTTPFDPEVTEYTAELVTYRDVPQTRITAVPFDALATVEICEDLSVNSGTNTYTITVTAEDGSTTQTYTVTAVK